MVLIVAFGWSHQTKDSKETPYMYFDLWSACTYINANQTTNVSILLKCLCCLLRSMLKILAPPRTESINKDHLSLHLFKTVKMDLIFKTFSK